MKVEELLSKMDMGVEINIFNKTTLESIYEGKAMYFHGKYRNLEVEYIRILDGKITIDIEPDEDV